MKSQPQERERQDVWRWRDHWKGLRGPLGSKEAGLLEGKPRGTPVVWGAKDDVVEQLDLE